MDTSWDSPREKRIRESARRLHGYFGSYARGWCDGRDGLSPGRGRRRGDCSGYDTGWLEGAAERERWLTREGIL